MRLLGIHGGVAAAFCIVVCSMACADGGKAPAAAKLTVEPGHPWTPPFGLKRCGRPLDAVVEVSAGVKPNEEYIVACYRDGREVRRQAVIFLGSPKRFGRVALDDWPSEAALLFKADAQAKPVEVARAEVKPPAFEADAAARPETVIHPVDLGTILPPADWLLLAGGQKAEIEAAALSRGGDIAGAAASAWFESLPERRASARLDLSRGRTAQVKMTLGPASTSLKRDVLHVVIADGAGKELWRKDIQVMLVPDRPQWPAFGAMATKLRYDQPIPVNGKPPIRYDTAWDPKLQDVVVFFPNGARFVFWRGSSYCPFWAGRSNTGFCYEWAEIHGKHMVGGYDCVEPLQDKELRYGRVAIVESTPARVHLRWSYQSCDLNYKVWGDFAVEDYYFYPDGLGTRALTLTANPHLDFVETDEFIIFTPQSAYPLDIVPANLVDVIWPAGKASFSLPCCSYAQPEQWAKLKTLPRDTPVLHRIRFGKLDRLAAIQYSPLGDLPGLPPDFAPFFDRGALVTPMYWGCHWPLSRGYATAYAISDRIHETPGHNSSIHTGTPRPLHSETGRMPNAQGKLETMKRDTWAWLIGMTDAGDDEVRQWADSFAHPPKMEVQGATLAAEPYAPERRALCLNVENNAVVVKITPVGHCVNPVFELKGAAKTLAAIRLNDRPLAAREYRWDGATLWLNVHLDRPATLALDLAGANDPR